MTTSYSKNIHISDLFVYNIYIGQSSLTFLQTKSGKNKNKLKTVYPKITKILRTSNLWSIFTGSYKECIPMLPSILEPSGSSLLRNLPHLKQITKNLTILHTNT